VPRAFVDREDRQMAFAIGGVSGAIGKATDLIQSFRRGSA
jgi:hypothetical protein